MAQAGSSVSRVLDGQSGSNGSSVRCPNATSPVTAISTPPTKTTEMRPLLDRFFFMVWTCYPRSFPRRQFAGFIRQRNVITAHWFRSASTISPRTSRYTCCGAGGV